MGTANFSTRTPPNSQTRTNTDPRITDLPGNPNDYFDHIEMCYRPGAGEAQLTKGEPDVLRAGPPRLRKHLGRRP